MSRNGPLKWAVAVVTLIGGVGGGVWAVELRYAKAYEVAQVRQEVREDVGEVKLLVLESHRDRLESEIDAMEVRNATLALAEWQRLAELKRRLRHVQEKITAIQEGLARSPRKVP